MHSFTRIFKYVWPQWPRLVTVVITAVIIAFLFSLSFMTVIPLLKVMMGEEGLHGWVDRKICGWRYGLDFYVPESTDFTASSNTDIAYYLLITRVGEDSHAAAEGVKLQDRIVGVGNSSITENQKRVSSAKLLEELATAEYGEVVTVQLKTVNKEGLLEDKQLQLRTKLDDEMVSGVKKLAIDTSQWVVGFLPREQGSANKAKAVTFIIILMGLVTIIRCIATFYQKYMGEKIVQNAIAQLREDTFAHVMTIPVGFFSKEGTSDTISRLINDISGMGEGVKILLGKALREPLKALFCLAGAMVISWKLTLIFLGCAPATIGLGILLGRKIKKYTRRSLVSSALMLGRLEGVINSLKVVKVYNQQEFESSAYQKLNRKLLKQRLRVTKVDAATGPTMEVLGMIAGSAALLVGVSWVTNANMQSSSFFGLLISLGIAAESVRKASGLWNKIQTANAASERVFAVVDESSEKEKPDATPIQPLSHKIEFKNVFFTYPGSEIPVLNGINLTVNAGDNIAVVGPNGSGKTTLINLIPRFYNVDSGSIIIDGQNINDCTLKSLRDQIAMVTQNVVTFNDTIEANIAYGKPSATKGQIIDAAKRSYAHEFIVNMPDGYDTVIGEQGAGLSGGQLQRIVIARAVLKNPAILIFDEATSQVDADSEAKIHRAIQEVMQDRTSFLIAHRFSTIINADIIVVMDKGQIIAQGQHEQLIENCPLYQSLYETQLIAAG